eukprot:3659258-Pyramimonas_sp.AAC.1
MGIVRKQSCLSKTPRRSHPSRMAAIASSPSSCSKPKWRGWTRLVLAAVVCGKLFAASLRIRALPPASTDLSGSQ